RRRWSGPDLPRSATPRRRRHRQRAVRRRGRGSVTWVAERSRLAVQGLHVHYDNVVALDGVNLTVEAGRICALIGMNGSGKSTLFKAIMGLVRPLRGQVTVHGSIGYVPQSEDVDWDFPVRVADVVLMGR